MDTEVAGGQRNIVIILNNQKCLERRNEGDFVKLHMTLNISAIIAYGIAAIVCLVISVLSFLGRGYLLNNSYIYASQEKRMTTNWRPFYRQTAICFVFLTVFL